MDSPLRKVVYCSVSEIRGTDHEIAAGVTDILSKARQKNSRLGVTGALLYYDERFAQVLEGPPEALDGLLAAIERDVRNRQVTVALDTPATKRDFPDWSMAFGAVGEHPSMAVAIDAVLAKAPHAGEEILALLKGLIVKEDDWLL